MVAITAKNASEYAASRSAVPVSSRIARSLEWADVDRPQPHTRRHTLADGAIKGERQLPRTTGATMGLLCQQGKRRANRENAYVFSRSDHAACERCRASAAVLCRSARLHARRRLFAERRVPRRTAHSTGLQLLDPDR